MTTPIQTARETLIAALAQDLANSYTADRDGSHLVSFLRRGFVGFDEMTLDELRQAAADAGLEERLAEPLSALEGAEPDLEGPDFTVTIEVSVTAENPTQAVQHAMDDLGDPALRWNARVQDLNAGRTVILDTIEALGI